MTLHCEQACEGHAGNAQFYTWEVLSRSLVLSESPGLILENAHILDLKIKRT